MLKIVVIYTVTLFYQINMYTFDHIQYIYIQIGNTK